MAEEKRTPKPIRVLNKTAMVLGYSMLAGGALAFVLVKSAKGGKVDIPRVPTIVDFNELISDPDVAEYFKEWLVKNKLVDTEAIRKAFVTAYDWSLLE